MAATALEILARYVLLNPLCEGRRVLDMGTTDVRALLALAEAGATEISATSSSKDSLQAALDQAEVEGIELYANSTQDIEDAAFDLIICHDLPARMAQDDQLLVELRRILAPEGYLAIGLSNPAGVGLRALFGEPQAADMSYEEMYQHIAPQFGVVSVFGQSPVVASLFYDLASEDEDPGLSFDRSLLTDDTEAPGSYVLLFGPERVERNELSIVQVALSEMARVNDVPSEIAVAAVPVVVEQPNNEELEALRATCAQLQSDLQSEHELLAQAHAELDAKVRELENAEERLLDSDANSQALATLTTERDQALEMLQNAEERLRTQQDVFQQQEMRIEQLSNALADADAAADTVHALANAAEEHASLLETAYAVIRQVEETLRNEQSIRTAFEQQVAGLLADQQTHSQRYEEALATAQAHASSLTYTFEMARVGHELATQSLGERDQEVLALRTQIHAQQDERHEADTQTQAGRQQMQERIQALQSALEEEKQGAEKLLASLTEVEATLESERAAQDARQAAHAAELGDMQAARDSARADTESRQSDLVAREAERDEARHQADALRAQIAARENDLEAKAGEIVALAQASQNHAQRLSELDGLVAEHESRTAELTELLERAQAELSAAKEETRQEKEGQDNLQNELGRLQDELDQRMSQLASYEATDKAEMQAMTAQLNAAQTAQRTLEEQLGRSRNDSESLEAQIRDLLDEAVQMRQLLDEREAQVAMHNEAPVLPLHEPSHTDNETQDVVVPEHTLPEPAAETVAVSDSDALFGELDLSRLPAAQGSKPAPQPVQMVSEEPKRPAMEDLEDLLATSIPPARR